MVKIRLRRVGRRKLPIYQIVAIDARKKRDGGFLEDVGHYEPVKSPHKITLKEDRVLYWLGIGAQPTNTVRSLIRSTGLFYKKALQKQGKTQEEIDNDLKKWNQNQERRILKGAERKKVRLARKKAESKKSKDASSKPETEAVETTG